MQKLLMAEMVYLGFLKEDPIQDVQQSWKQQQYVADHMIPRVKQIGDSK